MVGMNLELADLLERHEETSNAQVARRIGGETWERADVLAIFSRPELGSGLNFAGRVRSDERSIEQVVDEIGNWFTRHRVAPHFRVSPLTRPANLAQILERRGFVRTETETQMVRAAEDTEPSPNPRITIEPVEQRDLLPWAGIQHRGFNGLGAPSDLMLEMARSTASVSGNRLYLARLDGEPVGAGVLVAWAGVHGIYGVATLPEARGQGVATALVRHMVRDADRDMPLCLQAETGSSTQRWYERLGFRVVYDRTGWTLENKK